MLKIISYCLNIIILLEGVSFAQDNYETVRYFNSLTTCSDTNAYMEDFDCVYMKIEYPYFVDDSSYKLNEVVKSFIFQNYFDKPYNNFDIYSQEFFKEYERAQLSYKSPKWWYTIGIDTVIITNKIIAVSFGSYIYMGGAHGGSKTVTMNYEKETGRILDLDKIFVSDFESKINNILNNMIKRKSKPIDFFDYNNYAYNNINSRFLLGKKSIIFKFDWYDETYRSGAGECLIVSYDLLKNIFNPEYSYLNNQ